MGHAAVLHPVRLTGGDRPALFLAIRPRRQKMTNHQHQPLGVVSLAEVADPSQLWDIVLEEVIIPEGSNDTIQADNWL